MLFKKHIFTLSLVIIILFNTSRTENTYEEFKKYLVPIVGTVSSGKSIVLNALIKTDILDTGKEVTTKFIVIIRHDISLKKGYYKFTKINIKENGTKFEKVGKI